MTGVCPAALATCQVPVRRLQGPAYGVGEGCRLLGVHEMTGLREIANCLPLDFPDDVSMRISHEAIYQASYVRPTVGQP